MVAPWQVHRRLDVASHVVDDAAQVASRHVAHHQDLALHVFTRNEVGAAVFTDLGNCAQGHAGSRRRVNQRLPHGFDVRVRIKGIAHHQRKRHLAFEDLPHFLPDKSGLQCFGSGTDGHSVTGQRCAVKA